MSLIAVHPGAAYHIESLEAPRYAGYFNRLVRPESLSDIAFDADDVLLVPCRTPPARMTPHRTRLLRHLQDGGSIVAMGEARSDLWLPGISFTPQPTNWWWWLEEGPDLGVRIAAPEHPLFSYLSRFDLTWHLHGWFQPPDGADILATDGDGRAILYVDRVTTAGTMIVTSLDPFYHHGSHFMPATTRFLDGFLPWLRTGIRTGGQRLAPDRLSTGRPGSEADRRHPPVQQQHWTPQ